MDFIEELIRKNNEVKSNEYKNWLLSFVENKGMFSDDDFLYDETISKEDKDNVSLLSHFQTYIEKLADEQSVFPKEDAFGTYSFKMGGKYFEIVTVYGQGAFTTISKVEFNENDDYVYVDEEIPEDVLRAHELIQYIIVNKELIDKISPAKFGVHIGHACTLCTVAQSETLKFKKWYQDGALQKKIILKAPLKKLEELEKDFYSVRDLGYTEVEENTLIAVSLGIMSRREAEKYIKRLQAW